MAGCYDFIHRAWGVRLEIPADVKRELRIVQGLVLLAEVNIKAPFVERVYASDASDSGYGVLYRPAATADLRAAWRWRERWRFIQIRHQLLRSSHTSREVAHDGGYLL